LYHAQQEAAELLRKAEITKEWLDVAIGMKYQKITAALRKQQEKASGIISFYDDGYLVSSTITEKIEWNQKLLKQALEYMVNLGDDPGEYASIIYHIPEERYMQCSDTVRLILKPARHVVLGTPSFSLTIGRAA
jgi:hypothetical protein